MPNWLVPKYYAFSVLSFDSVNIILVSNYCVLCFVTISEKLFTCSMIQHLMCVYIYILSVIFLCVCVGTNRYNPHLYVSV